MVTIDKSKIEKYIEIFDIMGCDIDACDITFPTEVKYAIGTDTPALNIPMMSSLLDHFKTLGFKIEPYYVAYLIEFPIKHKGKGLRSTSSVPIWEKIELASFMQTYWCDNSVSFTVDFDPKTEGSQIESLISFYQYKLKCISFFPQVSDEDYKYSYKVLQEINSDEYYRRMANIKGSVSMVEFNEDMPDLFCTSEKCMLTADSIPKRH
jgi:hypothetical protein